MRAIILAALSLPLLVAGKHGKNKPEYIDFYCDDAFDDCYYTDVNKFVLDECGHIGGHHLYPPDSAWNYVRDPQSGKQVIGGLHATCLCAHGDTGGGKFAQDNPHYPFGYFYLDDHYDWNFNECHQPLEAESANETSPMLELKPGTGYYRKGKLYTA